MTATQPLSTTIQIRPVRESDLSRLEWDGEYRRYRRVYRENFEEAQRGQRIMLVAVDDETLVGQVFIQLNSAEAQFADSVHRAYLYALRVRAPWRGQGIGRKLLAAAEEELRARGFEYAVIAAGKDNLRALRLYQRQGYRIFTEDPGIWTFTDAEGETHRMEEPCWVLEKRL
jgi:ribosomal protein S18 acetylase RimI-like enzyme